MANRKSVDERYGDWWCNRTPVEMQLQALAFDYEKKYFADLRLVAPSIHRQVCVYEMKADSGEWIEASDDLDVSIQSWIFRACRTKKWLGQCQYKRRTINIVSGLDNTEHRATVLHEMIHAYESQLSQPFREWLLLDLHRRMLKRVKPARLQRYINASTHTLVHECSHGVLFLLKSVDLDLRFGWKLGTVFGYGRDEYFL